jgi:NAD+ kinase
LPRNAKVCFEILEAEKRPVSAVADFTEVRHVAKVELRQDRSQGVTLLFDADHDLDERILIEQFAH